MKLSSIRFLTSVKVKEDTSYCREAEYNIDLTDGIVRVEEKHSKAVSFVPIHNVAFYKVSNEQPQDKPKK